MLEALEVLRELASEPALRHALGRGVELYEAWDSAEPGRGHGEKASAWRTELEQHDSGE